MHRRHERLNIELGREPAGAHNDDTQPVVFSLGSWRPDMRRRDLIRLLGAAMTVFPQTVRAQPGKKGPIIGVLWHAGSAEEEGKFYRAVQNGFRDLGYVEGQTIRLEHRFPAEQYERFAAFAAELVRLPVDVLLPVTAPAAVAAKKATLSIPIVFLLVPDPVGSGLVENLSRPGGNATVSRRSPPTWLRSVSNY